MTPAWLAGLPLTTYEPEFHTEQYGGVTWRIVRQRQQTVVGELVVGLADGSNPQQQWLRSILLKVLLPELQGAVFQTYFVYSSELRGSVRVAALRDFLIDRMTPQNLGDTIR